MANMYPEKPKECAVESLEKRMFEALEYLSDEYSVFHSFSIVRVIEGTLYESETDFVIFHPKKGILCIEAKAGQITYEDGEWRYGSGLPMNHDGPFNQASQNKWKIKKYIEDQNLAYLLQKCKLLHAVWFPSVTKEYLSGKSLPSEADINLVLTQESIDHIESDIEKIFSVEVPRGIQTSLGNKDAEILMRRVLAPTFHLITLSELKSMHRKSVFKSMLREQIALLNYLEEQHTAIINGMAGTGKTIMAVEKARMHADAGEDVLFLCYNVKLKDFLQATYNHARVSYYTVDGMACKICDTKEADYEKFEERLLEYYTENNFPWKHVVIDEGQDFGQEKIEECRIIEIIETIVTENDNGTFYLFYDKNQMVQSRRVPSYIDKADCKLTLYRNCRNTENIAITTNRLLGASKKPKLISNPILGSSPEFYVMNNDDEYLDTVNMAIDSILEKNAAENIVILTCRTESISPMGKYCKNGVYHYRRYPIQFTTYRKFKGLEADAIIIVDIDSDLLNPDNAEGDKVLYVAASRARFELYLICDLSEDEAGNVLAKINTHRIGGRSRKSFKALATALNAKYKEKRE